MNKRKVLEKTRYIFESPLNDLKCDKCGLLTNRIHGYKHKAMCSDCVSVKVGLR
jgi:Zn finger protein HypA/HybF involved in hydrogenase expression